MAVEKGWRVKAVPGVPEENLVPVPTPSKALGALWKMAYCEPRLISDCGSKVYLG